MATLEDELKDLKEKNNELAQKVQYWKMTAAQKEDEKLELMKEINELRLKLSRLRNNGGFQARKLDAALQEASEKAISHLVKASAEIAKSMEIAKVYMRERQELDTQSPRWSSIGGTPKAEKSERVHRVPPMMIGGQSIQPVVALSRTMLNTSNPRSTTRSPNQNRSLTERAVPMHMLQDVYIPLTRIDISDLPNNNMEIEIDADLETNNAEDSPEEFVEHRLGGDDDSLDSDDHISEGDEYESSKLEPVSEEDPTVTAGEIEPVSLRLHISPMEDRWHRADPPRDKQPEPPKDKQPAPPQGGCPFENPLEGPSWLLDDAPTHSDAPTNSKGPASRNGRNLEPDSTTEVDKTPNTSCRKTGDNIETESSPSAARAFSPTMRRRKRTSSPPPLATPRQPHYSPRPSSWRRNSTSGRVLKVLVAKMRLDGSPGELSSPPKRPRSPSLSVFDAPSPNGATDSRVIVSESTTRLDVEITEQSARKTVRQGLEAQRVKPNSLERETQHKSRRRVSREHENSRRVASKHERRHNNQDGQHDSNRRGRLTSQDTRDVNQSSRQRSQIDSHESRDSDSGSGVGRDSVNEGRTRRVRKAVTCKEKSLNRIDSRDSDSRSGGGGDSVNEGRPRRARKAVTYKEKPLNRIDCHDSRDSDSSSGGGGDSVNEGRTRRVRKAVTYKEKPLDRIDSHDSCDSDSGSGRGGDSVNEGRTRKPRKTVTYKEKSLNSESTTRLDMEIAEQSAGTTLRQSLEAQQVRANSLERETQHTSRRSVSREHENSRRVASEHERRHNNQDGHDSNHRGRLTSQDTRDSNQSSRQRSRINGHDSHDSRDSDSGSGGAGDSVNEGRTRRVRKAVTYKEKPLNRKLRR